MSVPGTRTPGHGAPPDPLDPQARLEALFDAGSPQPLAAGGGVRAAAGRIEGLAAVAFAGDPRLHGGALGAAACEAGGAAYGTSGAPC
ncbi:hypothetical protein AB0L05_07180 [Nonomuraea pusilla]|uniref:hypothetical protein n=1 Tax=Nonomuraea pusilla TaxID=46177 RepID=UPI003330FEDF